MTVSFRTSVVALGVSATLLLSGCTTDKLANDYSTSSGTSYTDDNGAPVLVKPEDRAKAVDFTAKTEDGMPLTLGDYKGKVVVVNFWYATCGPCRAEAPTLQGLYQKYQDKGVAFVGVNIFDQPDQALSFEKKYGITYPSVMDLDSGAARIAFSGVIPPTATPTTYVLDAKGRLAARIVGQLESASILNSLISGTLSEGK
ncbi:TlpA disulfide reductase family protein [Glaciihabitans sp. UYNi722]|uniref:TlpA disulfide reductase family protein n=1 Tax=Glaciihabitans sp. UYNi722 TaxID=3156344 RepID=UPI003396B46C